ncbi:MAG: phosphonate transport system ATP-binding protein [Thermoleophilaceae bacterium]|jgi:phosphonate transport system ATP-binding protein|nr:phosphonate transport system ATP-binding protein [Thermoleophilaceae bacterium]
MFEVRGGGIRYGALRALEAVDLRIERGERVALIGPSGAGKTSLIGLLNGSLAPAEGQVLVLGSDLARASPRERRAVQRRLGTVRQQFDLVGQLRVVHNVNAGRLGSWSLWRAALSLLAPREVDVARRALSRVGLEDKLYARTDGLSGGQQQRVAIARVLAQEPVAILADEPIASIDPARAADVVKLMLALSAEAGTTLVVSLHDLPVALGRFDRIVALRDGRVAFDGPPERLSEDAIEELYAIDRRIE